jgi:hypothetical protein
MLGLEGDKQALLGFLILSRAWFGIILIPLSLLYLHCFYMLATVVITILVFILFMFFLIMFIVYFDYILSTAGLSSCSCICSYSTHPKDPWVSGWHCVSIVLIHCLPMDTPYIPDHVVDCGCDTPIESFVVHSLMSVAHRIKLRRKRALFLISLSNISDV